jgi:hypothetical protein
VAPACLLHAPAQDAAFTRDPWPLGIELRKLQGLQDVSVEWDTALWAPGQMIHEWEAVEVRSAQRAAGAGAWDGAGACSRAAAGANQSGAGRSAGRR